MANQNLETFSIHKLPQSILHPHPDTLVICQTCHTGLRAGDATVYHIVEPIDGGDHHLQETGELGFECDECNDAYFAALAASRG